MKTRASKTPAGQAKKNNAFFGKGGKGAFFGAQAAREPFFGGGADAETVQTKLTVGEPNDVYEKEADATADKVVQRLSEDKGAVQKKCADCEREKQVRKKPIF